MRQLVALDCSTFESTLNSISKIYNTKTEIIKSFLVSCNVDEMYKNFYETTGKNYSGCGDMILFKNFEKKFKKFYKKIDLVYWFHLTRTSFDSNFAEGILSLNNVTEILWNKVFNLFKNTKHYENLRKLKVDGVVHSDYKGKVGCYLNWGPYALLIRETAFNSDKMHNHDYLKLPEIIEHICEDYLKKYSVEIKPKIIESLKPCIVKFWSRKPLYKTYISAAIYYLYCKIHNEELCSLINRCYDGNGKGIPFAQIEKIEFVENYNNTH